MDEYMDAENLFNVVTDVKLAAVAERLTGARKPLEAVAKLCDMGYVREAVWIVDRLVNPKASVGQFMLFTLYSPEWFPEDCWLKRGDGGKHYFVLFLYLGGSEEGPRRDILCLAIERGPRTHSTSPAYYARPCTYTELAEIAQATVEEQEAAEYSAAAGEDYSWLNPQGRGER